MTLVLHPHEKHFLPVADQALQKSIRLIPSQNVLLYGGGKTREMYTTTIQTFTFCRRKKEKVFDWTITHPDLA